MPLRVGADIANVCNEAALIAARHSKECIEKDHFEQAIERVIAGLEKKARVCPACRLRYWLINNAGVHRLSGWVS
jgi:AFG3 family protein